MADLSPFASAGFAPTQLPPSVINQAPVDPFGAAGFAPGPQASAPVAPVTHETLGADMSGMPMWANPEDQRMQAEMNLRGLEKVGEGATLGLFPFASAGARRLFGTPLDQGLKEARDYTAQTSKDQPLLAGMAEGAGAVIPTALSFGTLGPAAAAARAAIPEVPYLAPLARTMLSGPVARTAIGGLLGASSAAGHDVGSGQTEALGSDTAKGAGLGAGMQAAGEVLGPLMQMVPNAAKSLVTGARNIFTQRGNQGIVGQVLREAGGDFPNQAATSPIAGLTLRVPQTTGNPGLFGLESALASEPGLQPSALGDVVTNNRTPNQVGALARAMVGSDAGIEPAVLTNQASARGVQAIQGADKSLGDVERSLWNAPELKSVQLNGPALANGVAQDVATMPASWRDAITGPQNKLGAYLKELHELGPTSSIADINSVRSRLLGVARDAASGPTPDSVTAAAANKMAGSILDRMGTDPSITGSPASTRFFMTEPMPLTHVEVPDPVTIRAAGSKGNYQVTGGETDAAPQFTAKPGATQFAITKPVAVSDQVPVPIHIRASAASETPPNPAAWNAYQTARDFTRQFNQAKGFNEFDNVLHPNTQGNMQGNAERQFGQFFDTSGGTSAGLQRLQGLSNFARKAGLHGPANELEASAQQYLRAAIMRQARAGNGLSPIGTPNMNLATLASTTNKVAPSLNATPMTAPIAGDIQAAGNAAELLNRPSTMRGTTNSTTYEQLRRNDLVNAILGQSATSGLGAVAGGYAGYHYAPEGTPAYLSIPGGALAGAMLAGTAGPAIGSVVSHTPILRDLGAGQSANIRRQIMEALANMPAYERAIATPMLAGPNIMQSGALTGAARAAAQLGIAPATGRTAH